ncbi:hypothetical protein [Eudoraea adriatica]|uniref:hypothetical protein n=1 Tax=Eudoraea adriatica TaxID=446681 RepID=UPI0012FA64E4|nr:hypothetical protein [Eudoraea adriatica]
MINEIGTKRPKKAKGRNVLTEINGPRHEDKRSIPKKRFSIKIVLSKNDNFLTD